MRTLLPLFKRSLQATLFVIAVTIILAALGVEIAPLLAGAGVVGLAIGFGSQTLVKDIVCGAFPYSMMHFESAMLRVRWRRCLCVRYA
jgi:small-conductance mechanosensitive channel